MLELSGAACLQVGSLFCTFSFNVTLKLHGSGVARKEQVHPPSIKWKQGSKKPTSTHLAMQHCGGFGDVSGRKGWGIGSSKRAQLVQHEADCLLKASRVQSTALNTCIVVPAIWLVSSLGKGSFSFPASSAGHMTQVRS